MRTKSVANVAASLCAMIALGTGPASASVWVNVDFLEPTDGGPQPPENILVVDVFAGVTAGDTWTAGALRGIALGGTALRYATDPNTGGNLVTNPGTGDRFVTFFSKPRERFADSRYTNGGAASAGCYGCPGGPISRATASEVYQMYFSSPPPNANSPSVDGWVFRVALDISAVQSLMRSPVEIFPIGEEPAGYSPLFLSVGESGNDWGTAAASFDQPTTSGISWGIYVRLEPGGGGLPGDFDGDCDVDIRDLATLLAHFGTPPGSGPPYGQGDVLGDGGVDLTDLTALLSHFGETCP